MQQLIADKKILFFSLIIALGLLSFILRGLFTDNNAHLARATAGVAGHTPVRGDIWTDTIGWIQMDGNNQSGVSYGVTVDEATGQFDKDSWAWSDNVGWVAFYKVKVCSGNATKVCIDNSGCGSSEGSCLSVSFPKDASNNEMTPACCGVVADCSACFSKPYIKGWAYVVSMGDQGWIRLDNSVDSIKYGITVQTGTTTASSTDWGEFKGYAWSGCTNLSTTTGCGLGWASFRGTTTVDKVAYGVTGRPDSPVLNGVQPTKDHANDSLTLNWVSGAFGTQWFEIWRTVRTCSSSPDSLSPGKACSNSSQCIFEDICETTKHYCNISTTTPCTQNSECTVDGDTCDLEKTYCKNTPGRPCQNNSTCVWSKPNGCSQLKCMNNPSQTCSVDGECASGHCGDYNQYSQLSTNTTNNRLFNTKLSFRDGFDNSPVLVDYTNYSYIVWACNIFGCAASDPKSSYTSPFFIANFLADPVCVKASGNANSEVTLKWQAVSADSAKTITSFDLQYCLLDSTLNPAACDTGGWRSDGINSIIADTTDPIDSNYSYTHTIADGSRYNYRVYRIRAVSSSSKVCTDDMHGGNSCTSDADCGNVSNACGPLTSSWFLSRVFRVCIPANNYQEVRPQ